MDADLCLRNCRLLTPGGPLRGGVAVRDGLIVAVATDEGLPPAPETIDGEGRWLLPGLVDAHVHFRDPGLPDREDFLTGSRAALRGGVTTVIDMPNTLPPVATAAALEAKARAVAERALVDYALVAAVTGENLEEIGPLAAAGAVAFKAFLGPTTGDLPSPDDRGLLAAMRRVAATGQPFAVHAENPALVADATAAVRARGRIDPLAHAEARPPLAEVESVQRMICFARATGVRLHVLHLSTAEAARHVGVAKAAGVPVAAETCPHYLTLSTADLARLGAVAKMNPPLRAPAEGEGLWAALRAGVIDWVATDHAPHRLEDKRRPAILDNASGVSSIQFFLPLMLEQVARGRLGLADLVRVTEEAPARAYGLYPRKGAIAVGSDADLVLVDLERRDAIRAADMENRVPLTPYEGVVCRGWPVLTLRRGCVVARDGRVTARPGTGRFLRAG